MKVFFFNKILSLVIKESLQKSLENKAKATNYVPYPQSTQKPSHGRRIESIQYRSWIILPTLVPINT